MFSFKQPCNNDLYSALIIQKTMKTVEVIYIPTMRTVKREKGRYLKILCYKGKTIFKEERPFLLCIYKSILEWMDIVS